MVTKAAPQSDTRSSARRAVAARAEHRGDAKGPLPNAFAYTVPDACRMGGFGRTLLYRLAKDGHLRLLKAGGRTLVCGDSLRALVAGMAS